MAIHAIGAITDPGKTRVALVQGQQILSAPATALSTAVGLVSGGTTGQVLTKSSSTDYDTGWADTGSFSGPASAVSGNLVAFDGTTGKLGKDSGIAYEAGAWTPTLLGGTTSGTYAYTTQTGTYLTIGKLVQIEFVITIASVTTGGTGNLYLGGLPYPSNSTYAFHRVGTVGSVLSPQSVPPNFAGWTMRGDSNLSRMLIQAFSAASAAISSVTIDNFAKAGTQLIGSLTYVRA